MELWNDFEGKTVADKYRLDHLIGPKGRSAFFSTTNGTGTPSVIRLIESHFDEEEILARWNIVTGLEQDALIKMRACGQTVLDGTHLVYAVMEPTDAELGDILRERTLTGEETRQVAISIVEALTTLHKQNLVHEHVNAANVFAIGEAVKLRSDCIREAPEGAEGEAIQRHDIHDLCVLLLECLTRQTQLPAVGAMRLPAPFEEVVRNGIAGTWNLQQIGNALRPPTLAAAPRPAPSAAAPTAAKPAPSADKAAPVSAVAPTSAARPAADLDEIAFKPRTPARSISERLTDPSNTPGGQSAAPKIPGRISVGNREVESRHIGLLVAVVIGILFFGWLGLHLMHRSNAAPAAPAAQNNTPDSPPVTVRQRPSAAIASNGTRLAPPPPAVTPVPAAADNQPAAAPPAGAGHWRVIAYTYNKRDQAQHKADDITQKYPGYTAEVFSPKGRSPYMVTLGGWMSVEDAAAYKAKARKAGVARDVYTQNFNGR